MKEQDILFKVVDIFETEFPNFNVQTKGNDGEVTLPAIVVDWDTSRRSEYEGNNPIGGYETDSDGNVTGIVLQQYYQMQLNIEVKSNDESERDTTLTQIKNHFSPFEWDAGLFHEDTTEWEVGNIKPRNNPVIEPDWYQAGILVQFRFVDEVVYNDVDAVTSIQQNVDKN